MTSTFVPTQTLEPFLSDPGKRVMVRRSFCFWQSGTRVRGSFSWGKPTEHDVVEMCEVFEGCVSSSFGAEPSLIDVRALESLSLMSFERFVRIVAERRALWQPLAGKQAILHDGGFPAALVLGALQIAAVGMDLRVFDEPRRAFEWLGAPDVEHDVERLRASLLEPPDVVRRVRAALLEEERPLSARVLARKVGVSVRSLQRHLAAAGTTVRIERVEHIVGRAEKLLDTTDLDLAAIAATVGLASPAQLVTLFRARRRTTPDAWRRSRRGVAD